MIRNGGNSVGSKRIKLNFKLLQGREIGTIIEEQKNEISKLEQVRFEQKDEQYRFIFENGFYMLVMRDALLYHTLLRYENDCLYFEFSPKGVVSGMIAYSLYETKGLPLEFTVEVLSRRGVPVDEEGFHIMEMLQRERNKNTYKQKDAFGQSKKQDNVEKQDV